MSKTKITAIVSASIIAIILIGIIATYALKKAHRRADLKADPALAEYLKTGTYPGNTADNSEIPSQNDLNPDLESNFRKILETAYPDFANFENQKSFAGTKVKFQMYDNDRYYAYMIFGSGLPITEATCFRVDRTGGVFKIGVFPDTADSYIGYRDINPRNCHGIK